MQPSKNVILRLSRYRRSLLDLRDLGYERVFSRNLGEAAGVSAVQVRKDFSLFRISGKRKAGYRIDSLLDRLNELLRKSHTQDVILVGAGNLGSALLKYRGFAREAIRIVAAFDADPAKHSRGGAIPILPMPEIFSFVRQHRIRIAILAVPASVAQEVAEQLVSSGILGILNFAPVSLKVPERVIVNSINLAVELESLIYHVTAIERT